MQLPTKWSGLSSLVIAILVANVVRAESADSQQRQLVRPNSLVGWGHTDTPPLGWTVDGQRLRGCEHGTPLVSAWTFRDFTLECSCSMSDDGAVELRLLQGGPTASGWYSIVLEGTDATPQVADGDKPLVANVRRNGHGREVRRLRIERSGSALRVAVDGKPLPKINVVAEQRLTLALCVPRGVAVVEKLTLCEPLGEPIFNNTDLTGWATERKQDVWTVHDGELVTTRNGGEYLRSAREYGDFTISFDYLLDAGGNSGLGFRTPRGRWPSADGMELQILDRPSRDAHAQMSIYKYLPPLERPDVSEAWNHVVVKCEGPIVTAWVNGQIAQHADLDQHPQLAKKPRSGWLGFQHHGSKTRIKNVYLLPAPADVAAAEAVEGTETP